MCDRTELLEAALESLADGVALLSEECRVVFWSQAAEFITGHSRLELVGKPMPEALHALLQSPASSGDAECDSTTETGHASLVHARHKLGHEIVTMTRIYALRDPLGARIGTGILFHPARSLEALPHGPCEAFVPESTQLDLEERLQSQYDDFTQSDLPFGVLWVNIDQAHELRKSHGTTACEAMLDKMKRALANGLRPGEEIGRWGDDDFLVLSHECTSEMLTAHARLLAGLARTTDFRWWGDRLSLTVSVGAAQAIKAESLAQLLERSQEAMIASIHAGGNCISAAPGDKACLRS